MDFYYITEFEHEVNYKYLNYRILIIELVSKFISFRHRAHVMRNLLADVFFAQFHMEGIPIIRL